MENCTDEDFEGVLVRASNVEFKSAVFKVLTSELSLFDVSEGSTVTFLNCSTQWPPFQPLVQPIFSPFSALF